MKRTIVNSFYAYLLRRKKKLLTRREKQPFLKSFHAERGKPRLLMLPDKKDWAFDYLCRQRAEYLADTWNVTICYLSENPEIDPSRYDLMFNPNQRCTRYDALFRGRFVRGFFSLKWARSDAPAKKLYRYLRGAVGCVAPSREIAEMIRCYFSPVWVVREGIDPNIFYWMGDRTVDTLVVGWAGDPDRKMRGLNVKRLYSVVKPACEMAGVPLRVATSLSQVELNRFYNDVDVVVIASQPLSEGNPLAIYEAGACGRTVIATNVGTVPEVIVSGYNGFVIEATFDDRKTVQQLVEKLIWCKLHLSETRIMGKRLRERILKERTPEKTCESFRVAMENALELVDLKRSQFSLRNRFCPHCVK